MRRHPAVAALAGAGAARRDRRGGGDRPGKRSPPARARPRRGARLEAVANLRKARDAVDRMLTRVSEERLKDIPQVEPVQHACWRTRWSFTATSPAKPTATRRFSSSRARRTDGLAASTTNPVGTTRPSVVFSRRWQSRTSSLPHSPQSRSIGWDWLAPITTWALSGTRVAARSRPRIA